ncbi:mitochondrial glycine transporter-like [Actinia tenebrosa]|uniref:Mitochondrial glycine transporter n=1 Tax=Actinia tenebrosa TaxID=6105 RepID=A0A6P8J398_ACTTE|nr:mitochondrial glycine transporter-like [Actinia tenebrosa]
MNDKRSLPKAFLAGALSGTCSTILFQPLDLVKTRIQAQAIPTTATGNGGMFYTFYSVVRTDHVSGLWRGLVPSIYRCVPGVAMYFCSLHGLTSLFGTENPSPMQSIALGASARSVAGICLLPITVVKTRYESGKFNYKNMQDAFVSIWRSEGSKGLYSGLLATVARDAPFSGLYLMFYTQIKRRARDLLQVRDLSSRQNFTCGLIAGFLSSIVTQPADVVKTRLQLNPYKYASNKDAVLCILKDNGVEGLFRGLIPRTIRRAFMAAMAWTVYEEVMRYFQLKSQ